METEAYSIRGEVYFHLGMYEKAISDFDKAIDILRKKGQKVSASRSDRKTSEGVVVYRLNDENSKGFILSFHAIFQWVSVANLKASSNFEPSA